MKPWLNDGPVLLIDDASVRSSTFRLGCFHTLRARSTDLSLRSVEKKDKTRLLFCIFIDNKTTDGDLGNSRQHGAILFQCLVTPCVSRMVLQFSIYRTTSVWVKSVEKHTFT